MSDRRKFLRGVGLFGALAAGAASVRANSVPVVINNNYTDRKSTRLNSSH